MTGTSAVIWTPSGPSSLRARRISKPAIPATENPPSIPKKRMRSTTGVVVSTASMIKKSPLASSPMRRMPPINPAEREPPKRSPSTETAIDSMLMMGNLPSKRSWGSMTTPVIPPEICTPGIPWIELTDALRAILKSVGSFSKSSKIRPMLRISMGMKSGHRKALPLPPKSRLTAKAASGLSRLPVRKLRSPSMKKL